MFENEEAPISAKGRLAQILEAHPVGVTEIVPGETIDDIVIEAIAKSSKVDLGEEVIQIEKVNGAKMAIGGQDAVGAAVFTRGRVQAVLVAADGCSFGHRARSAQAARITVKTVLEEGLEIASQATLTKDEVLDKLVKSLESSHLRIKNKASGGATTAAATIISQERTNGKNQIYLYVAASGDSQVMIVSKDSENRVRVKRIVEPADAADKALRQKLGDLENLGVNIAALERQDLIREIAQRAGWSKQQATDHLTQSGIYAFLGGEVDLGVRAFRVNLTADRFEKGHTDVKVMVCSDNAGEKVSEQEIAQIYKSSGGDNKDMALGLNTLMKSRNQDDGCLAICSVSPVV